MIEQRTPVSVYRAQAYCECGGELKGMGYSNLTSPPIHPHKCDRCGEVENLRKQYPTIVYGDKA